MKYERLDNIDPSRLGYGCTERTRKRKSSGLLAWA